MQNQTTVANFSLTQTSTIEDVAMSKTTKMSPQWELAIVEHMRAVNFQPTFNKPSVSLSRGEKVFYAVLLIGVLGAWFAF